MNEIEITITKYLLFTLLIIPIGIYPTIRLVGVALLTISAWTLDNDDGNFLKFGLKPRPVVILPILESWNVLLLEAHTLFSRPFVLTKQVNLAFMANSERLFVQLNLRVIVLACRVLNFITA